MKIHRKVKPFPIELKDGWSTALEAECVNALEKQRQEKPRAYPTSQKGQGKTDHVILVKNFLFNG